MPARTTTTGRGGAYIILLVAFLVTAGVVSAVLAAAEPEATEALEARVDGYLQPYVETGNFSGSVLVARRGEVLVSKAYGHSDEAGEVPNPTSTVST